MKKLILAVTLTTILILAGHQNAYAKRLLPRAGGTRTTGAVTSTSSSPVGVKVHLRGDRLAIEVDFTNLSAASSLTYMFSYDTRGTTQGASGSVNVAENNTSREIIFGTCSHGVCRFDYGITNAKFVVTINFSDGHRIVKTFRIKV